MQRRKLFTKILKPVVGIDEYSGFITPPYFSGEFNCIDCAHDCISSCDRGLLSFDEGRVVFSLKDRGCNFCKECAIACEALGKGVLGLNFKPKVGAKISIDVGSCLAWNSIMCYNCLDACKYNAINFLGVFRPMVNENCNSCGECINRCFNDSIKLESL